MKRFYLLLIVIWIFTGKAIAQNPFSTAVQIDTNFVPSAIFKSTLVTTGNGSNAASISENSIPAVDGTDIRIFPSSNPQSEVNISIDPTNSNNILVSAQTIWGNSIQGYYYSNDGGQTWNGSDHLPNSAYGRGDPCTAFDAQGNGYIVSMSPDANISNGQAPDPNGYYMLKTTDHGASWQSEVRGYGPVSSFDKEMIAIDNSPGSPYKNNFYCAWTDFTSSTTMNGYVKFNSLPAGSSTFSPAITLRSNNGIGQGVNVQTGPNGEVYVCWADYPGSMPATGIGFVKSTDGGQTFSSASIAFSYSGIRMTGGLDTRFNCRINDFPSMAVDKSNGPHRGRIYIAYPTGGSGTSVIQVRYSDDQGSTWSQPKTVSISGATQSFFPWITVDDSTGIVCIAYYAFDTSVQYGTDTYLAYSSDGGQTYSNIKVSDVSHTTAPISGFGGGYAGDYIGVAAYGGKAYPAWMDNRNGTWQVYVSPVRFSFGPLSISGPDTVYSTANYSITNLPLNGNVTWSISPSGGTLYIVSQNNDTAVVGNHNWYSSNFTLKATVTIGSDTTVLTKSVRAQTVICPSISATYTMQPCNNQNGIYNQPVNLDGTPNFIDYGCPIDITFTTSEALSFQLTSGTPLTWTSGSDYLYVAIDSPVTFSVNFAGEAGGTCTKTILLMPTGTYYTYSLSASPNPASSTLNVNITAANTRSDATAAANTQSSPSQAKSHLKPNDVSEQNTEIELYNMITNKLVKQWKFTDGLKYQLNVSGIQRGMYIMKVFKGNLQLTSKILIE